MSDSAKGWAMYELRKQYYFKKNKQLLCKFNLFSLVATVGLACYTFFTLQTEATVGNKCADENVKWFLYLVLVLHGTNILQDVCKITQLDDCFCNHKWNTWLDLYEILIVGLMTWIFSTSTYCEGTEQFYICLGINTLVYWGLLFFMIFFNMKAHCTYVSKDEINKFLNGDKDQSKSKPTQNTTIQQ